MFGFHCHSGHNFTVFQIPYTSVLMLGNHFCIFSTTWDKYLGLGDYSLFFTSHVGIIVAKVNGLPFLYKILLTSLETTLQASLSPPYSAFSTPPPFLVMTRLNNVCWSTVSPHFDICLFLSCCQLAHVPRYSG